MTDQVISGTIEAVLDIARWAPSGDNAQPWTFRVIGAREIELLVRRTNPNIYEYRKGEPTLISAGGLLENVAIAAPAFGLEAIWRYTGSDSGIDRIVISFQDQEVVSAPELFPQITQRSVDRRPFRMRALSDEQKLLLAKTLNLDMEVQWYESLVNRYKIAALSALATKIRLTIPETFEIHRQIVDWENRESEKGIPSRALGLDPLTLVLTRWSMGRWSRTRFMNAMGAPSFAALQMDFLPGLFSASYFVLRSKRGSIESDSGPVQALEWGQAIQRFWLTATKLGLVIQPCVAILAFWTYAARGQEFTICPSARQRASLLAVGAKAIFGDDGDIVFIARIGQPRSKSASRSVRLPLAKLWNREVTAS